MKKNVFVPVIVAALLSACGQNKKEDNTESVQQSPATDSVAKQPDAPLDSASMMKAWESYMTPGQMHQWMAESDGEWDANFTFWMSADTNVSDKSSATVTNKMIMGGRYQQSDYKGNMGGMPFEGRSVMAYDNASKKFVNTWHDNMGTGLMYMTGQYDEANKSLNLSGTSVDPMTGKEHGMRQVYKIINNKHHVMEMFDDKGAGEYRSMKVHLTKK